MSRVYVSDTNIWIDFRNAGLLDELFRLPFALCCTEFVLHELTDLDLAALLQRGLQVDVLDEALIHLLYTLMTAHNNSSLADVSCYLLAKNTGRPLLTGDGRLRKQAMHDGLEVHGVLWLLDRLVEHTVVAPEVASRGLQAMLKQGARLPAAECQSRLSGWGA